MRKLTFILVLLSFFSCKKDIYRDALVYSLKEDLQEYSVPKNLYKTSPNKDYSYKYSEILKTDSLLNKLKNSPKSEFNNDKKTTLKLLRNYKLPNNFLSKNYLKGDATINRLYLNRNIELLRFKNLKNYCFYISQRSGCGFTKIEALFSHSIKKILLSFLSVG